MKPSASRISDRARARALRMSRNSVRPARALAALHPLPLRYRSIGNRLSSHGVSADAVKQSPEAAPPAGA